MNCSPNEPTGKDLGKESHARDDDASDPSDKRIDDATRDQQYDLSTPTVDATGEQHEDLSAPVGDFDDMGLKEDLLRGIYGYGFESPSMIQQCAIRPLAFETRDLIAQAQSGTGKTATFAIGTLQNIDAKMKACQAIILSPTRELAHQSASVASALGRFLGVEVVACTGGASLRDQANKLRRGAQLIVATPGRVKDLIERRILNVSATRLLVLDEADEMLSAGFRDDIFDVIQSLPSSVRLAFFSATLPPEALEVAEEWMPNEPVKIIVKKEELTLDGLRSYFVYVGDDERNKLPTLLDLYESLSITQCVIFCNFRRQVEWLYEKLNEADFTCSAIHSDLTADERNQVMRAFRGGESRVLIATDVLARGIDVQQINLVINFDLPRDRANYIHRVGRSARFGRKGSAINFVAGNADVRTLRDIETHYDTHIDELPRDVSVLA